MAPSGSIVAEVERVAFQPALDLRASFAEDAGHRGHAALVSSQQRDQLLAVPLLGGRQGSIGPLPWSPRLSGGRDARGRGGRRRRRGRHAWRAHVLGKVFELDGSAVRKDDGHTERLFQLAYVE